LSEALAKLSEIWAKVIRFGQDQNLVSPKAFDPLRLCSHTVHFLWQKCSKSCS